MSPLTKAYLQLHLAVFLFGFTAILGRLISVDEAPLVWYRLIITSLSLLLLPGIIKKLKKIPLRSALSLAGIGCLVCLHWVTFYGSIKYANVSIALSCLATASFFTAFIEPLVFKQKIKPVEVILGLVVIGGIYLIFFFTDFEEMGVGIILGLLSAFFAAVFSTMNKKMVERHDTLSITFIELSSAFVFLSLLMPFYLQVFPAASIVPTLNDWLYLFILSLVCTSFAYVISLNALKHISAFKSNLTINLEPIYGIILAILIFQEHQEVGRQFYIGTGLIISAVFMHPLLHRALYRKKKPPIV